MSLKLGDETLCCWQPEDASGQLDYRYDEFGFKVEEEGAHVIFILLYKTIISRAFWNMSFLILHSDIMYYLVWIM